MSKTSHSQSRSRPINKATMDEPQEEFIAPEANAVTEDEPEAESVQRVSQPDQSPSAPKPN